MAADDHEDAAFVQLMDDMQVLIGMRAGRTVTQDDVDSLNRLDAYWREDGERVIDAYVRGHRDGLILTGGDPLVAATERADVLEARLVTEKAMRKLDEQRGFRRGAQACRETMARFVEQGGDAATAASIRANWNPSWGDDPGMPESEAA